MTPIICSELIAGEPVDVLSASCEYKHCTHGDAESTLLYTVKHNVVFTFDTVEHSGI